jgi:hypothetical protein
VDDAAESIATLATSMIDGTEVVNIGYRGTYSIEKLVTTAYDIFGRQIDYQIRQPIFEFDLSRAYRRNAVPACSLREALVKFGRQI